jgi:predicted phage gp36 major capsid-like protein
MPLQRGARMEDPDVGDKHRRSASWSRRWEAPARVLARVGGASGERSGERGGGYMARAGYRAKGISGWMGLLGQTGGVSFVF